jgi:hypothetical protein
LICEAIRSTLSPVSLISFDCASEAVSSRVAMSRACVDLDLLGGVVDAPDQATQLFDRVIDRVGDGAGDVLGHRRLHGEIAVRHLLQLVHQPKNGGLVDLVGALGFLLEPLRLHPLDLGFGRALARVLEQHLDDRNGSSRPIRTPP